jgi:hypothetical protein
MMWNDKMYLNAICSPSAHTNHHIFNDIEDHNTYVKE